MNRIRPQNVDYFYFAQGDDVPRLVSSLDVQMQWTDSFMLEHWMSLPNVRPVGTLWPRSKRLHMYWLYWDDGTDLRSLDEKVNAGLYADADFAGAVRTQYSGTICFSCHRRWNTLIIPPGDPYLGAPGLYEEKLEEWGPKLKSCPACRSSLRQLVVHIFGEHEHPMLEEFCVYTRERPTEAEVADALDALGSSRSARREDASSSRSDVWCSRVAAQLSSPATDTPPMVKRMLGATPPWSLRFSYSPSPAGELQAVELAEMIARRWGAVIFTHMWKMFDSDGVRQTFSSRTPFCRVEELVPMGQSFALVFATTPDLEVGLANCHATHVRDDQLLEEYVSAELGKKNAWLWPGETLAGSHFIEEDHAQAVVSAPRSIERCPPGAVPLCVRKASLDVFGIDVRCLVRTWFGYHAGYADRALALAIAEKLIDTGAGLMFSLFHAALTADELTRMRHSGRGLLDIVRSE